MTTSYFDQSSLQWLLGIEDTCVYPPAGSSMGRLDEHHLTGHDDHWRDDFDQIKRLGATGMRYGVSWPLVHTAPGEFDWSVLDARIDYAVNTLGLTIVADLVHYGTPTWLDASFADERYPDAIALFAGRFAERYCGVVNHITPLNEPITTASFCGLRGVWPPALTGWDGWTDVTVQIVDGLRRSIDAIRRVNPEAVVVHVEASALYETTDPNLHDAVRHHEAIARLPTELLLGRVDEGHPLWGFLVGHGAVPERLRSFTKKVPKIDILGVNYYPDLTPRTLRRVGDNVLQVTTNRGAEGLEHVLLDAYARYGVPVAITETSIEGTPEVRQAWLEESTALVHAMHAGGFDIRGYTWWPLVDFVDWSYASGGRNVEEFISDNESESLEGKIRADGTLVSTDHPLFFRKMGLISVVETNLTREVTSAAAQFATSIHPRPVRNL